MTGLVLAGGRSMRMGADKAQLRIGGRRLVDLAVATLAVVCGRVLVAAGTRQLEDVPAEQIRDAPGEGPLAGIVAGLRHAEDDLVAVIAVDMPHASPTVLAALAAVWHGEPAVVPVVDGVAQPLHAVYATWASAALEDLLRQGQRSPQQALERLGARYVGADVWGAADATGAFATNLNVPADLASLPAVDR